MATPGLIFPDPDSFDPGWDGMWDAPNGLTYQWITESPRGVPIAGYWNVVGTVGRQGPQGEPGPMGAPGMYPTVNSATGCWTYNYQDYKPDGTVGDEQVVLSNYPAAMTARVLGIKPISFVNELNNESKWDERKKYNRNDAFMVETYDANDNPTSRLFMIPWHELLDEDMRPLETNEAKLAHSFVDMGYLGVSGQTGAKGDQGPQGLKGLSKCQVVNSMPRGEEEGEMFLDKSTNTMFIAVNPVS